MRDLITNPSELIKLILGQARLDGAFCPYTKQDKLEWLKSLNENGVTNIEMESTCFAALTKLAGIKSAIGKLIVHHISARWHFKQ